MRKTYWSILALILLLGCSGSIYLYRAFLSDAQRAWYAQAEQASRWVSDTTLSWIEGSYAPLSALVVLFENSDEVSEAAFLNGFDGLASRTTAFQLDAAAYVRYLAQEDRWHIIYTTDPQGILSKTADINQLGEVSGTLRTAMHRTGRMELGPVFINPAGEAMAAVAMAPSYSSTSDILMGLINFDALFKGLEALHIPPGIDVSMEAKFLGSTSSPITIHQTDQSDTVHSFVNRTVSAGADITVVSHISTHFAGGPSRYLAYFSLIAGLAGTVITVLFLGMLLRTNELVNIRVQRATEELYDAKIAAETANRAKSLFLANMSHELRTPMNAILGYAQLLQHDGDITSKQRSCIDTIHRSGEHLLHLINSVLDISKIEAQQIPVDPSVFDFHLLLGEIKTQFLTTMGFKGLHWEIRGVQDTPRYIKTDREKLRQILIHLLDNAVKYTTQGGVILRVSTHAKHQGRVELVIEVEDTGCGIEEQDFERIFRYFEQVHSGGDGKTALNHSDNSGAGLGLSICREYARMLQGRLEVSSIVGRGSIFSFQMRVEAGQGADLKDQSIQPAVIGLDPFQRPVRVLVVEDNRSNRDLLVQLLKGIGMLVTSAANGKEALEIARQWKPHFIWMDLRMPVMDGYEACRIIRSWRWGKKVKIAALTAHPLSKSTQEESSGDFDDWVQKPYREQQIFTIMGKQLQLSYLYEEPSIPTSAPLDNTQLNNSQFNNAQSAKTHSVDTAIIDELRQAAQALDQERCLVAIDKIRDHDPELSKRLRVCADTFLFERLVDYLDQIK